jgi:hypothetical protein
MMQPEPSPDTHALWLSTANGPWAKEGDGTGWECLDAIDFTERSSDSYPLRWVVLPIGETPGPKTQPVFSEDRDTKEATFAVWYFLRGTGGEWKLFFRGPKKACRKQAKHTLQLFRQGWFRDFYVPLGIVARVLPLGSDPNKDVAVSTVEAEG